MSITVLHQTNPKARTPHYCSCCGRIIAKGETYERQDNVFDGHRYAYKICIHCRALTNRVLSLPVPPWWFEDGINEDALQEALGDYAQSLADLRLLVWFRRRWTRRDGSLVPVYEPTVSDHANGSGA